MGLNTNYFAITLLVISALQADEIYVTSAEDMGPGTLRAAMEAATAKDFIIFDESLSHQTISLNSNLPPINGSLNIVGPSGGNAVVNGNDTYRLFRVLGGTVAISQVDLTHPDTSAAGGALYADSFATVSLSDLVISPPGNNSIFIKDYAQLTTENISIPPSDANTLPHTFLFSTGSNCTICTYLDNMTSVSATGSGSITTMGAGLTALDTGQAAVDFAIQAKEGTLRFQGNSTQPIIVSPGSMLKGSNGSLYIANRGTIKTGSSIGTSSIIGDLIETAGSTLQAEIAPNGGSDQYLVGGNAYIAGNLFVLAEKGIFFKGQSFTFLTTGGVVNGVFDTTSSNSNGLAYTISYFPQSIQIDIVQNLLSFDGNSFRGNISEVYSVLANATVTPDSDLGRVITLLNLLDPPDPFEKALMELTPTSLVDLNWNELATLHDLNSVLIQQKEALCCKPCYCCCRHCKKNGLWAAAIGEKLRQGRLDEMQSFHTSTYGALVGYDRMLSDNSSLGIAGSYTNGHLSWNGDGGKTHIDRYTGALYFSLYLGKVQFDITAMGSYSKNHIQREVPSLDRKAHSDPSGHAVMGHVGASYLFAAKHVTITPFVTGEYFYTKINSLHEKGAASIDLHTRPFKTNFARGEAGIAIGDKFCTCWGIFYPLLSLSYVRLVSSDTHIKSTFEGAAESFTVHATKHIFNEIAPAATLGFTLGNSVWISATYEAEFAKKRQDQSLNFNLRVRF